MSQETKQLQQSFSDICSRSDAEAAYVDFHNLIEDMNPTIPQVLELNEDIAFGARKPLALVSIMAAKSVEIPIARKSYFTKLRRGSRLTGVFRGSGIIALGEGGYGGASILVAAYHDVDGVPGGPNDPAQEQYGPTYPRLGLRKLGQAALLARQGLYRPTEQQPYLEDLLVAHGLKEAGPIHDLGYCAISISRGRFVAAGASGMLPTPEFARHLRRQHLPALMSNHPAALVNWEQGAFGGLLDRTAAATAANLYASLRSGPMIDQIISPVQRVQIV